MNVYNVERRIREQVVQRVKIAKVHRQTTDFALRQANSKFWAQEWKNVWNDTEQVLERAVVTRVQRRLFKQLRSFRFAWER